MSARTKGLDALGNFVAFEIMRTPGPESFWAIRTSRQCPEVYLQILIAIYIRVLAWRMQYDPMREARSQRSVHRYKYPCDAPRGWRRRRQNKHDGGCASQPTPEATNDDGWNSGCRRQEAMRHTLVLAGFSWIICSSSTSLSTAAILSL